MLVVYEKNILDKMNDEIIKARKIGRVISRFELSDGEIIEYIYYCGFGDVRHFKGIQVVRGSK